MTKFKTRALHITLPLYAQVQKCRFGNFLILPKWHFEPVHVREFLIARLARSDPRSSFLCRPCIFIFVLAFSLLPLHFHKKYHIKTFWRIMNWYNYILSLKSIFSIRSILSLRSSLSSDVGLDSFESCFWGNWRLDDVDTTDLAEAAEVNRLKRFLMPGKSLLRTSRFLNSNLWRLYFDVLQKIFWENNQKWCWIVEPFLSETIEAVWGQKSFKWWSKHKFPLLRKPLSISFW